MKSPLFDKFELEGYSCEVNKRDEVVSEVSVFKQNERIAWLQFKIADTRRDSIIELGRWLTDSSMITDHLLLQYEMEKNKIGEKSIFISLEIPYKSGKLHLSNKNIPHNAIKKVATT